MLDFWGGGIIFKSESSVLKMLLCFTCSFFHIVSEACSFLEQVNFAEKYLSRKCCSQYWEESVTLLDRELPKKKLKCHSCR